MGIDPLENITPDAAANISASPSPAVGAPIVAANSPSAPIAGAATVTAFTSFNYAAAGEVYKTAGTVDLKGADWTYVGYGPEDITIDHVDVDATIKGSSVETNLNAVAAGLAGTDLADEAAIFKNTILKHPDLKESLGKLLKDEGEGALEGMKALLAGNGAMDMAQFERMMEKEQYRKALAQVFNATGETKWQMADAVKFSRLLNDTMQNPADQERRKAFRDHATAMGVDVNTLEAQYMEDMSGEMLRKLMSGDIEGFGQDLNRLIVLGIESMGLDPQMTNQMIAGATGLTGFFVSSAGYYAFGEGNQPGLVQITQGALEKMDVSGDQLRKQVHAGTPGFGLV